MTPEGVPSFKLVLVGDGGTGKPEILKAERMEKKGRREKETTPLLLLAFSCFSPPRAACSLFEREDADRGRTLKAPER